MYWKKGDNKIAAPTVLAYTIGQTYDMQLTLVTEAGEELTNAYLLVADGSFAGLMKAKKASESTYREIREAFNAECFLGDLASETGTVIDIRVEFPPGTADGYRIVPILIGHGDGTVLPNPFFVSDWPVLWLDEWISVWAEDW